MARFDREANLALKYAREGKLDQSEQLCQQVLRVDAQHAGALHALGLVAHARGDRSLALSCLGEAARRSRSNPLPHINLGVVQQSLGQLEAAETSYRQALRLTPSDPRVLGNLGGVLGSQGRYLEAVAACSQALQLSPHNPQALTNLGSALRKLNRLPEAVRALRIAIDLAPDFDLAWLNLGLALWTQGQPQQALAALERGAEANPQNSDIQNAVGSVLQEQGELEAAANHFQRALELNPQSLAALRNYAVNLQFRGRLDEAVQHHRAVLQQCPTAADSHFNLAGLLLDEGESEQACRHFELAARFDPTASYRVTSAIFLPAVYQSRDDIYHWRARLAAGVEQLYQEGLRLDPQNDLISTSFYLAYQGLNDVDLQRSISRLYRTAKPQPRSAMPGRPLVDRKIRVGFISRYFWDHTIGKLNAGLIANLRRDIFDVTVVSLKPKNDARAAAIRQAADHYIDCPTILRDAWRLLASTNFDVLFYTDVGMDVVTRTLAMSRFAPVQCTTWGHPVTTGMPTIDYFISSQLLEPADAVAHYSERLTILPTLPSYYYRPLPLENPRPRSTWGLSDDRNIYLCPQALFKFHPDFDPLLADILRRDPQGELVLIDGRRRQLAHKLLDRFRRTMPDVADRVTVLPRMTERDFAHLIAASNVMLDTLHFGGGNTTYEAMSVGTPIVTLPGAFMRSRVTAALYRKMGLADCVARSPEHYVELAHRLATDHGHREQVRQRILAANHAIYEDTQAVRTLEEFLASAVDAAWRQQQTASQGEATHGATAE